MVPFVQDGTTYKETSSQSPQHPFVIVRNPWWVFFVLDILFVAESGSGERLWWGTWGGRGVRVVP